jgi:hypothetical protein
MSIFCDASPHPPRRGVTPSPDRIRRPVSAGRARRAATDPRKTRSNPVSGVWSSTGEGTGICPVVLIKFLVNTPAAGYCRLHSPRGTWAVINGRAGATDATGRGMGVFCCALSSSHVDGGPGIEGLCPADGRLPRTPASRRSRSRDRPSSVVRRAFIFTATATPHARADGCCPSLPRVCAPCG